MTTIEAAGCTVLEFARETLDAKTAQLGRAELQEQIRGHQHVILDLSRVTFVDSAGLGVLIGCLRQVKQGRGELSLCGLTSNVRTLFQLCHMHRLFQIYNTREEALRAFRIKDPRGSETS